MPKNQRKSETDTEAAELAKKRKQTKADEAKREKEKEKLEADNKKQAFADYHERLAKVEQLKAMTDTPAWQALYGEIQADIAKHREDILDTEKPREMMRHQEGVKILRGLIDRIRVKVEALNTFVNNTPLFAPAEVARANFNEALGTVELTR